MNVEQQVTRPLVWTEYWVNELCYSNYTFTWPCIVTNFFIIEPTRCTDFTNFILAWNSTCVRQFLCPSSGVYSLYTEQWFMSYRFVDSFRAGPVWHIPLRMYSWWWTVELSETCRVSCQNKFVKLVHLVGFIIKKYISTVCTPVDLLTQYTNRTGSYTIPSLGHTEVYIPDSRGKSHQ